jgi:hypothetical protein
MSIIGKKKKKDNHAVTSGKGWRKLMGENRQKQGL